MKVSCVAAFQSLDRSKRRGIVPSDDELGAIPEELEVIIEYPLPNNPGAFDLGLETRLANRQIVPANAKDLASSVRSLSTLETTLNRNGKLRILGSFRYLDLASGFPATPIMVNASARSARTVHS